MIAYITLGTNDMDRAGTFYDALFAERGASRVMEHETYIGWSQGPDQPIFSVHTPFDGNPATVGNGVMVALAAGKPRDGEPAPRESAIPRRDRRRGTGRKGGSLLHRLLSGSRREQAQLLLYESGLRGGVVFDKKLHRPLFRREITAGDYGTPINSKVRGLLI